ncbi:hypothetical protein AB6806_27725 [Bosea sp. RCC_152_1]|uniref:hypothetical protein n=1 Tax=Bosea sp. RCC_152_1 TaxID=3239228 RepID=UPI003523824D
MTPLSTPAAQGTVAPEELAKQIADAAADMCEIARIADEWRRGPKQSLTAIREIRAMTYLASPSPEALPASGMEARCKSCNGHGLIGGWRVGDGYDAEPCPNCTPTRAWEDVLAERRRQTASEGWTAEHDDQHSAGELAKAAACYAAGTTFERELSAEERRAHRTKQTKTEGLWPWDRSWWKPADRRRDLVKAGALILAEIERLDRAALTAAPAPEDQDDG